MPINMDRFEGLRVTFEVPFTKGAEEKCKGIEALAALSEAGVTPTSCVYVIIDEDGKELMHIDENDMPSAISDKAFHG